MNLFKSTLLFSILSLSTLSLSAAPYCDESRENHSNRRCRSSTLKKIQNSELDEVLREGIETLSRRISERHITELNSNYIAFIHASKACYEKNEAGLFTADLAGSTHCAGIRDSHLARSLEIYARMEKTTVKELSLRAERNPESLYDLISFLKHQTQDNLDRTNDVWHQIYSELRKSGAPRKSKATGS